MALISCVILRNSLDLSGLQLYHLYNGELELLGFVYLTGPCEENHSPPEMVKAWQINRSNAFHIFILAGKLKNFF